MLMNNNEYLDLVQTIKQEIQQAQYKATLSVNKELIMLYYNIGKIINEHKSWGNKFIENLAADIKLSFPNAKGYSVRNLKYMSKFASTYPDEQFVQTVSAQIPWSHNVAILDKEGKAVGYARSVWAMISMETRKPADLLTLHGGSITDYVCDKECPISKPGRIKVTEKTPVSEYQTRYSDIDINGHVNSIKYIEHILDLFPIEFFKEKRIKRFEMAYVAESYYGDILSFYREEVGEKEYDIEVKKNGTDVVVRSKVIFI